ncbi:putative zinc-finger of transcription factor IIIC complex-domain-containing protein [Panaeolus papilionaceus]|nr:putative zinc-finger of transcription factor IIIC complex-domain-containing protein [Panaeolus papilionaceus]
MNQDQNDDEHPIYTALNIPTVISWPSTRSLQWSADGQLAFATKSAVYLMTPDHGINFGLDSTTKATPNKDDAAIGWFKTIIQHDKINAFRWPEYSQAWGAVSLGSIDLSLTAVAVSPSGISHNGGCVFATLSSNMDFYLWAAEKNYLKGEWIQTFSGTPYMLNSINPHEDNTSLATVLKAQIISILWTPQADFGVSPAPYIDGSLLVLGNRGGGLHFLRYKEGSNPEVVYAQDVSDFWITHIAFSGWTLPQEGISQGYLAYGTSEGEVGLIKVREAIHMDMKNFTFGPQYDIQSTFEKSTDLAIESEIKAGVTALEWVELDERGPILVCTYPGVVKLWSAAESDESNTGFWTGLRSLRIQSQRISADSSPMHPVSGINYVPKRDLLIVTLFDGSFHVIRDFSTSPVWAGHPKPDEPLTSAALSGVSRAIFKKVEKGNVDRGDMIQMNGTTSYDDNSTLVWVYESSRPSDFSYKQDAQHNGMLVVTGMLGDDDDSDLLHNISVLLRSVRAAGGLSPLHLLRPYLFHLRDPDILERHLDGLLDIVKVQEGEDDYSLNVQVDHWTTTQLTPDLRSKFRYALQTNLYGFSAMLSLRMRLSIADFCWKLTSRDEIRQAECGVVAQGLLTTISHRILRTMVRHLAAVTKMMTVSDIPFVTRVIVQSLLPGTPENLTEERNRLSSAVQYLLVKEGETPATGPIPEAVLATQLVERCPACNVEILLEDPTNAVCSNGHRWGRCSITTFILSTPSVRTCVGCSRKAFLPPSGHPTLPEIAQGWVVEELLEAVNRCLYCNNRFISVL